MLSGMLSRLNPFGSSPTHLSPPEAEQWLYNNGAYLFYHETPHLSHYYHTLAANDSAFRSQYPKKTEEAVRQAVIRTFKEHLTRRCVMEDVNAHLINIGEIYPDLKGLPFEEQCSRINSRTKKESDTTAAQQKEVALQLQAQPPEQVLLQAEKTRQAAGVYIEKRQPHIPPNATLKEKIEFFEDVITKALRGKTASSYPSLEQHLRSHAVHAVLKNIAPSLKEALIDPNQDASPMIDELVGAKEDLLQLHKFSYPDGFTPEGACISYAFPDADQSNSKEHLLHKSMCELAEAENKDTGGAQREHYRRKYGQLVWASKYAGIEATPIDSSAVFVVPKESLQREVRNPRKDDDVESNSSEDSSYEIINREEIDVKQKKHVKDTDDSFENYFVKSYIEVLFEEKGIAPNGAILKQLPLGQRYRLYKLGLREPKNPWAKALWNYELRLDPYFRPTLKTYEIEQQIIKPGISGNKTLSAVYEVVQAVEAGSSPSELHQVISKVPEKFFQDQAFSVHLQRQAKAEREDIDPKRGRCDQSPIIAQAMVAWFDEQISVVADHRSPSSRPHTFKTNVKTTYPSCN